MKHPRRILLAAAAALAASAALGAGGKAKGGGEPDIANFDRNMAIADAAPADGMKWIDGRDLPIEGRAFDDTEHYYDRLPSNVTEKVNGGVRKMKHHTAGMQFRFTTDSKKLVFKWTPYFGRLDMDHMPSTGVSDIDVYRLDAGRGKWLYVKTGRVKSAKGASLSLDWTPGTPCLVNLPLYNGVKDFTLGVEQSAAVSPLPPRKSGVAKPVVFYGTSITRQSVYQIKTYIFKSDIFCNLDSTYRAFGIVPPAY